LTVCAAHRSGIDTGAVFAYYAGIARGRALITVGDRRRTREARARKVKAFYVLVQVIKGERGCTDCGNDDFRVLDFDHRDRDTKSFGIADVMPKGYSGTWRTRVLAEIEKCDVRCANCHRVKTWDENLLASL